MGVCLRHVDKIHAGERRACERGLKPVKAASAKNLGASGGGRVASSLYDIGPRDGFDVGVVACLLVSYILDPVEG